MDNNKNDNIKKVIKFYFVWSEDKEAQWLRDMANKGWHLKNASIFYYTFEKGDSEDFVYQFDFRMNSSKEEKEYLDLFKASGWEFINRLGGWYYFRKLYKEGGQNEIYSDKESLKQKYKKLLGFLLLTGFPLFFNFFTILRPYGQSGFYKYFWPFNTFLFVIWLYAFIRIIIYVRKLSKEE